MQYEFINYSYFKPIYNIQDIISHFNEIGEWIKLCINFDRFYKHDFFIRSINFPNLYACRVYQCDSNDFSQMTPFDIVNYKVKNCIYFLYKINTKNNDTSLCIYFVTHYSYGPISSLISTLTNGAPINTFEIGDLVDRIDRFNHIMKFVDIINEKK